MQTAQRYTTVAIALHWIIALAIIVMIPMGVIMHDMKDNPALQFELFQWHKSVGITVLLLSVVRLVWRLMHPAPPLPDNMQPWERVAARLTHIGFYVLMIGIPLTGWAIVSTAWDASTNSPLDLPTYLFGVIPWPHLTFLEAFGPRKELVEIFAETHELLAFSTAGLIVLHVAAALKHHFILKDDVLVRMSPHPQRMK